MLKHTEIPAGKRIRILHSPGGAGLAPALLLGEGLFRFEEHCVLDISIHDGDAKYLKALLHGSCTTGPEPVHSRSLLAGLGYEAGIDGYCNAVSLRRFEERLVERKPVERLLEVLTEPALTRLAELRHSGEVESSFMCKEKFHGLDEESSKRFA